ncbi:hypothetical protein VB834_27995 [Limnoraphis robusta Tam1]|nr:hypothetical protein [Limnoraphis robusta]MEA5542877.1 hypothetical protein [Limnoraphis robusta Tam1]
MTSRLSKLAKIRLSLKKPIVPAAIMLQLREAIEQLLSIMVAQTV